VLATDALLLSGGELAPVSDEIKAELSSFLPEHWSHANPIDVLGDAEGPRYARTLEIAAKDPASDGLLVILTPQAMTESTRTAELLAPYAQKLGKPILASWMGGPDIAEGEKILNKANIPTYPYPDTACRVFTYMVQYSKRLQSLYETPALPMEKSSQAPDRAAAEKLIASVRAAGRTLLTEAESKQLLSAYNIPTVQTRVAETPDAAAKAADEMGYPVVVKIHSEVITHKTDVGGVKLNIQDAAGVREAFEQIRKSVHEKKGEFAADGQRNMLGVTVQQMVKLDGYELILGSSIDPQFGPVILFGTGGQLVEVFKDSALALPPLNTTLARRMMEQTKIYHALHGVRGRKPVDIAALERLLVRFSHLIVEQPWVKELDMNPIMASPDRIIALDARVVLHDLNTPEDKLPRPAIRPYPVQYFSTWSKDNTNYVIRPLRPEDEPTLIAFHKDLSEQNVTRRFLTNLTYDERVAHERLSRICFLDYDRELALAAVVNDDNGNRKIAGVARFAKHQGSSVADFWLIVADGSQSTGVGTELLKRLIAAAKAEKVSKLIRLEVLADDEPMHKSCNEVGGLWTPIENGRAKVEIGIL
jgi:acetyltransferase